MTEAVRLLSLTLARAAPYNGGRCASLVLSARTVDKFTSCEVITFIETFMDPIGTLIGRPAFITGTP